VDDARRAAKSGGQCSRLTAGSLRVCVMSRQR
jgi:hypothetical protein